MKFIAILFLYFIFTSNTFAQEKKDKTINTSYKNYIDIYPEQIKPQLFSWYHENFLLLFDMPAKVQISFKYNILYNENAKDDSGLYAAYTYLSLLELFQNLANGHLTLL